MVRGLQIQLSDWSSGRAVQPHVYYEELAYSRRVGAQLVRSGPLA